MPSWRTKSSPGSQAGGAVEREIAGGDAAARYRRHDVDLVGQAAPEASLILSMARSTDIANAVARVPPPDMVTITSVSGSSPGARDFHS